MKIYSAIQIGDYHQNHCEDHLFASDYGKNTILCAVMDGCTTAIESQFASVLVGKILKKICNEKGYKDFIEQNTLTSNVEENLKSILKDLLIELKTIKNLLLLDTKELLTTLIILLVDKTNQEGIVLAIGDGVVVINGQKTEFEQENTPDYLGYHLNEDFDTFYNSQKQKIKFNQLVDVSIATDGILTFEKVLSQKSKEEIDILQYLTQDDTNHGKSEMLYLKLKHLENEYGLKPTDDFSLIRIIEKA